MGRAALTAEDEAAFRRAMREVATRRFAKHGEAGVTMRGLAEELGCSPMTPYRYYRDKAAIFGEVRAAAIAAFGAAQARAFTTESDPVRRLHVLGRAYAAYAVAHPDQYRVMFQLEHAVDRDGKERDALDITAWMPMRNTVAEAVTSGVLAGDPDELAHIYWAGLHGLVSLHLAGKLRIGRHLDSLIGPVIDHLIAGARVSRPTRPPPRRKPR